MTGVRWISEQHEDGALAFRVGRLGSELVAEFAGVGTLVASRDGVTSSFHAEPGADPSTVDKVKKSLVPALLRHASSKLTLHGAAVAKAGKVVSLIGASGAGKSTLAAHLCAHHGAALVADDTTAIDVVGDAVESPPTESVSWLVDGSIDPRPGVTKTPVSPARIATAPGALAAICALRFDASAETAELVRLRGQDALSRLVPNVIRLVVDEPAAQVWEVTSLARLLSRVAVFELRRPPGARGQEDSAALVASLVAPGEDKSA